MPATPKGIANSLPGASSAAQSTPPKDTTSPLSRAGLAELLRTAATPAPEHEAPPSETPVAPADAPETAAGTTELPAAEGETPPTEAGDQSADATDLSNSEHSETPPEPEEEENGLTERAQKRIGELRHKLGDAEREAQRLKSELDAAREEAARKPEPAAPRATGLLSAEESRLADQEQRLKTALATIRANPDGLEVEGRAFTAEQLAEHREEFEAQLAAVKVERRQYAARKAQQTQLLREQAEKQHPWIKDRTDPRSVILRNSLAEYPGLEHEPGVVGMIAAAIAYHEIQAKAAKTKAAPPAKPPPPAPAPQAAAPPKTGGHQAEAAQAFEALKKTGSRDALAGLLKARGL
jgi:hypothetical protein